MYGPVRPPLTSLCDDECAALGMAEIDATFLALCLDDICVILGSRLSCLQRSMWRVPIRQRRSTRAAVAQPALRGCALARRAKMRALARTRAAQVAAAKAAWLMAVPRAKAAPEKRAERRAQAVPHP